MAIVGCAEQLSKLHNLLLACTHDRGHAAVVTGAAASGKTEILQSFAEHATASGALWLSATGSRDESAIHLGVLTQLLTSIAPSPAWNARVSALLNDAFDVTSPDLPTVAAERAEVQIMHGLCAALRELSRQHRVLITVDDVHHADRPSMRYLSYLVRRLRSSRVMTVLTKSDFLRRAHPLFDFDLVYQAHNRHIRLTPLSVEGVADVLAEHMDASAAAGLAAACHQISGGNPLLVRALSSDSHSSGKDSPGPRPAEPDVGDAFSDAVLTCLRREEPELLRGARGLAVLDDHGSSARLHRLLDVGRTSAEQVVDALSTIGLLDGDRFRHPAIQAAVLGDREFEDRSDMHHRAGQLLLLDGANATVVARHLIAADHVCDPWGIPILLEAAEQARRDDQLDVEVECLKLALRACEDDGQRATIAVMLTQSMWRLCPNAAGRHLTPLVPALHRDRLSGRHALVTLRAMIWQGRIDEAAGVFERLTAAADPLDAEGAAELRSTRQWLEGFCPPALGRARQESSATKVRLRPPVTASPQVQATALLATLLTQGPGAGTIAHAEHILQLSRLDDTTLEGIASALFTLVYVDSLDKAATWCRSLLRDATARNAPTWQALFESIHAEISLRMGNLPAAEAQARSALTRLSPRSWGTAIAAPLASLVRVATETGQHQEAAQLLKQPLPDAVFQTRFGLQFLFARGHHYLATGSAHAALSDFLTCGELMRDWGLDQPSLVSWRTGAAAAELRLGNQAQAKQLLVQQLSRPGAEGGRTRGATLRLLAATSDVRPRLDLLWEAVTALQACGDNLELAYALADLSHAHRDLGDVNRARIMASKARGIATECGAELLRATLPIEFSAPLSARLDEDAEKPADTTALSSAERRVASLAALGHTNREIAHKLHITMSTVEQHLTRTYRKLKVKQRSDLSARLVLQPSEPW